MAMTDAQIEELIADSLNGDGTTLGIWGNNLGADGAAALRTAYPGGIVHV